MLVLHIGTHKTGTSALQAFLAANAEALQQHGVRYIEAGRPKRLAHHMLAWSIRGRRNTNISIWDGVRGEIARTPDTTHVLSSEGFWFEDPVRVKELLGYDGPVKIVAYLRRQDQFLQSLYKQTVADGRKKDFDTWLADVPHRGDYATVMNAWAVVFGADAIVARPYQRNGENIDTIADFLSLLNIDKAIVPDVRPGTTYNPSPRRELLHFLRAFNQLNLKIDYEKFFHSVMGRDKAYKRSIDLLTYEQRRAVLDRYEQCNREITERYWKEEIPLFPDLQDKELPTIWSQDDPEYFQLTVHFLEAVVKLISGEVEIAQKRRQDAKAP
ncbi:MAG TPA: hypothetical protein VMF58_12885 [Rhizomicrobium sp.]|nr:hypothetical protein [Rhizomicrobium sp.]